MPIAAKPSSCSFSGLSKPVTSRLVLPKAWPGPALLSSPACGSIKCSSWTTFATTVPPLTLRSSSMKGGGASRPELRAGFIYLFPAKYAQQTIRNKLKYLTSRRAPISPQEFVAKVNPLVTGGVNYFRHTNASQAFRGLQRFVNIRVRRYLTQRSKGRGFGWQRYPNSKRYAMGLAYIGSGKLEYGAKPVHGGR